MKQIMKFIDIYIIISILFSLSYIYVLSIFSIYPYIICIVHNLDILGIIWNI